jgi:hypothetical protein
VRRRGAGRETEGEGSGKWEEEEEGEEYKGELRAKGGRKDGIGRRKEEGKARSLLM